MDKKQVSLLLLQSLVQGANPNMSTKDIELYVETAIELAEALNRALKDDQE